jgi:hypothetical protein
MNDRLKPIPRESNPQTRLITIEVPDANGASEIRNEFLAQLEVRAEELGFTLGTDVFVHCNIIPQNGGEANVLAKVTLSVAAQRNRANAMELHDFLDEWDTNPTLPAL